MMKAQHYPWKENAVLVCDDGHGERRIAGQGSLYAMVHRLLIVNEGSRNRYTITLPDRQVAPYAYSGDDFVALMLEQRRARV